MSRRRKRLGAVSPRVDAIKRQAAEAIGRDIRAMDSADDCRSELGFLVTAVLDLEHMHAQGVTDQYIEESVQDAEDEFVFRCVRQDKRGRGRER